MNKRTLKQTNAQCTLSPVQVQESHIDVVCVFCVIVTVLKR